MSEDYPELSEWVLSERGRESTEVKADMKLEAEAGAWGQPRDTGGRSPRGRADGQVSDSSSRTESKFLLLSC